MTRDQHLQFCNRCLNRKFDPNHGIVCGLTNRMANFDPTCENFKVDESVKVEKSIEEPVQNHQMVTGLSEDAKALLRNQQDVSFAVIGGAAAALLGAVLWAIITVATNYQIGYMAVAVGLIVGFTVRYFGAGVDQHFGFIGAGFALFGCLLGNLLSQVGFAADAEGLTYFQTITLLTPEIIFNIYKDTFHPMDILFYGIAGYEGYKFAFRSIAESDLKLGADGKLAPPPFTQYRLPAIGVLLLFFAVGGFFLMKGSTGVTTFYYESGSQRATGEMSNGKENGPWQGWWENGKVQYEGYFKNGLQDSVWKFYDEDGVLYRYARFSKGLMHGVSTDYFPSGKVSAETKYVYGRLHGPYMLYLEDGSLAEQGNYFLDNIDGVVETFHNNKKLKSKGNYKQDMQIGKWEEWSEDGKLLSHLEFTEEGMPRFINTWNDKGIAEVINGNGVVQVLAADGTLLETGIVNNGLRDKWKLFYADGKVMEEGEYRNDVYYLQQAYTPDGTHTVKNGEGKFERLMDDGINTLSGTIQGGLKVGKWLVTNMEEVVIQETNFENGKANGPTTNYFNDGTKAMEGALKDDKRVGKWIWYYENGQVESEVTFVQGKKEGEQFFYDEDGMLLRKEVYKDGLLLQIVPMLGEENN